MNLVLFFLSSVLLLVIVKAKPAQINTNNKDSVLEHLSALGFGEKKDSRGGLQRMLDKDNALKESILYTRLISYCLILLLFRLLFTMLFKRKYQKFHRLKETGVIDKETAKLMTTPRCGLPDLVERKVAALRGRKIAC